LEYIGDCKLYQIASKIDVTEIKSEISKLSSELEMLKSEIQNSKISQFDDFFEMAIFKIKDIIEEREKFEKLSEHLAIYLTGNTSQFDIRETFLTLAEFACR